MKRCLFSVFDFSILSAMNARHLLAFVVLTFAIRHTADAAIIYVSSSTPIPYDSGGVYLNPSSGLTAGSQPGTFDTAPWINPFQGGVFVASSGLFCPIITGSDQIVNVAGGSMIDSSQTYAPPAASGSSTHMGPGGNQFQVNTPGYIGFQMKSSPTSDTYYGWMQVSFNNTGGGSILSYAYENSPGTGITAGFSSVPEPSRAMLLMLGLGAALFKRQRRTTP
ncbi:MAG: PEP-CTERM sorting domain-containing protein [Verrucomicrobiaceae bacterium]|nr:PEP-CTERM sorting domain-containing protein [Verrucomicrobiaceae bacterium]